MTKTRNLSDLLDANGKVDNTDILNVDAAKITTGTLDAGRIDNASLANVTALPFNAGTDWQTTPKTATFTAVSGKGYFANTSGGSFNMNLPAGTAGATVSVADYAGTWQTNAVTIVPDGTDKIGSTNANATLSTEGQSVTFVYVDSTQGWINVIDSTSNVRGSPPYNAEYLLVAGGGSGGSRNSGGGGAGGHLTNFGGTAISLQVSNTYTVTVGAGGSQPPTESQGNDGDDSVLSGAGITTITAIGGGGGGGSSGSGNAGGSGGGAGCFNTSTSGAGTAGQGNNGGVGDGNRQPYAAGGGGGASAVGGNGTSSGGGAGGAGLANSITGSSVTRAGGGGGNAYNSGGAGGAGGGGAGAATNGNGSDGTANTGGGGGGNRSNTTQGGAGGSGVVVLRVPTANYSNTTTGSPTVSVSGSDTIMVFNGSGSYTA